jgi:peptidoglycan/xylan/chitin deacetylase (PgdA/CDA1 family)
MSVRSSLGQLRREALCSLYRRTVPIADRGPIVSFTFDDFPRTAYSVGGRVLADHGVRGTYYAAVGLMNTWNELGEQFRFADVDSLLDQGHELASHTYSHISCRSTSWTAYRDDVEKGQKAIDDLGGSLSGNFAYPFGDVTLRAKRRLGSALTSARSIIPGFNGPEIDLNLLRANRLYGDVDCAGRADALLLENTRRKSWLIFYTHDVRLNPSAFGCTPALLESAVSCAARSGSLILTVQEALAEVGIQNESVPREICVH